MTLRRFGGLVAGLMALAALAPVVLTPDAAWAQQVDPAVNDLRQYDVTFEDGTLTTSQLDQLDSALSRLQGGDGYVKAVVLGSNVDDFTSNRAFADEVRRQLGGDGSVVVYSSGEVGIASSVASSSEVANAERAAADRLNAGESYATATTAAARQLGVASSSGSSGDSGGFPWGWLLVIIGLPLLLMWFMWRSARKHQNRAAKLSAEEIGLAESKVRTGVDKVANDLLELADRVDRPDTAPEARDAFSQGAEMFTEMQGMLDQADTRPELDDAYAKVNEASHQLDTARSLMDGQPAPDRPEAEELFPRPAAAPAAVPTEGQVPQPASVPSQPAPDVHYRKPDMSPWITAAAMAAMTMLSQRGMSQPQTRPPMNDNAFGSWISGLPSSAPSRSSAGRRGGSSGRGRIGTPSGQRRERGMGRR